MWFSGLICVVLVMLMSNLLVGAERKFYGVEGKSDVYILIKMNKDIYHLGERVNITLLLVNNKKTKLTLNSAGLRLEIHPSSFGLTIHDLRVEPITVLPNSEHPLGNIVWCQTDVNRNQVPFGTYTIKVSLLEYDVYGKKTIKIQ